MKQERQQFYGKWWIHLAAVLLLLVAQCIAVAHAVDHLTHAPTVLCELFEAVENHDGSVSNDFVSCLPLSFRDGYSQFLPEHFQPLTEQRYLVRAPPAIWSK